MVADPFHRLNAAEAGHHGVPHLQVLHPDLPCGRQDAGAAQEAQRGDDNLAVAAVHTRGEEGVLAGVEGAAAVTGIAVAAAAVAAAIAAATAATAALDAAAAAAAIAARATQAGAAGRIPARAKRGTRLAWLARCTPHAALEAATATATAGIGGPASAASTAVGHVAEAACVVAAGPRAATTAARNQQRRGGGGGPARRFDDKAAATAAAILAAGAALAAHDDRQDRPGRQVEVAHHLGTQAAIARRARWRHRRRQTRLCGRHRRRGRENAAVRRCSRTSPRPVAFGPVPLRLRATPYQVQSPDR